MQKGDVVLDVGAHIGLFSLYAYGKGAAQVLAYEPNPVNFDALKANISLNNATNVRAFKIAVLPGVTSTIFHIPRSKYKDRSSVFEIVKEDHEDISVDCVSLDELVKQNGLTHIDFLKLDAEGAEHKILADSRCLDLVEKIAVEGHDVEGHPKEEVVDRLKENGFSTKAEIPPTDGLTIYAYGWRKGT